MLIDSIIKKLQEYRAKNGNVNLTICGVDDAYGHFAYFEDFEIEGDSIIGYDPGKTI